MASPEVATEVELKCGRCESDLDTEGSPRWCKKCRAKYQREYQSLRKEMNESRGYAAGCSAMRDFMVGYFAQFGNVRLSGFEASAMARKAGIPQ
jgi:hypothetical protein